MDRRRDAIARRALLPSCGLIEFHRDNYVACFPRPYSWRFLGISPVPPPPPIFSVPHPPDFFCPMDFPFLSPFPPASLGRAVTKNFFPHGLRTFFRISGERRSERVLATPSLNFSVWPNCFRYFRSKAGGVMTPGNF